MLTYGGFPLLLPDPDGELGQWLRFNQDVSDVVEFGDRTVSDVSPRRGLLNWYGVRKGIGQTIPNYAAPPPAKLNTLYWPTGATRWARGYFLATETQKNKIVAAAHSDGGNSALTLAMGDADHATVLSTSMYLLPPRIVSRPGAPLFNADESLWLLPLVDARYWWQHTHTDDLSISTSTAWPDLFSTLSTRLGSTVSLPTAAVAAYLKPDPYEFTRRYENAALMLDAAALSLGKRVIRRLDGTVRAESFGDASTVFATNSNAPWQKMAGGEHSISRGDKPEKVMVTFRKWRHYALLQKGQLYKEEVSPTEAKALASGTRKVIHSTLHADCSTSDSSPSNTSELSALAAQVAADYYGWFGKRYDVTFAGVKAWLPCGYDDSIVWDFGYQLPSGERRASTRVQSMPVDFGFDHQLSQNGDKLLFEPVIVIKADDPISKGGGPETCSVWNWTLAGGWADSTLNIEAYAKGAAITEDVFSFGNWVDDHWEATPWECGS